MKHALGPPRIAASAHSADMGMDSSFFSSVGGAYGGHDVFSFTIGAGVGC